MDPRLLEKLKSALNVNDKTQDENVPGRDPMAYTREQAVNNALAVQEKYNNAVPMREQMNNADGNGKDFFKTLREVGGMQQQVNAAMGQYAPQGSTPPGQPIGLPVQDRAMAARTHFFGNHLERFGVIAPEAQRWNALQSMLMQAIGVAPETEVSDGRTNVGTYVGY